ncbi:MAG: hypothetical protein ACYC27_20965 [Armatimonadota bacterium]
MITAKRITVIVLLTLGWMIFLIPVLFIGAIFMHPYSGEKDPDLSYGYKLNTPVYKDGGVIYDHLDYLDSPVFIGPGVDGYQVISDLVVGHVSCSIYGGRCEPGYFVLNMRTDKVRQGLSRVEWLKALKDNGITDEPKLSRPKY